MANCKNCGKAVTSAPLLCRECAEHTMQIPARIGSVVVFRNPAGNLGAVCCESAEDAEDFLRGISSAARVKER